MERRGRTGQPTATEPVVTASGSAKSTQPGETVEYIDPADLEEIMDQMGFVKDGNDRWELVEQVDEDDEWDSDEEDDEAYRVTMEKRKLLKEKKEEPKVDFQNTREFMEGSVGFLTLLLVLSMVGFLTITFVFVEKEWKEGDWMLLPLLPLEAAAVVFAWYRGARVQVGLVQVLGFAYKLRHPLLAVLMTVFLITNQACLVGIVLIKRKITALYGSGRGDSDKEAKDKEEADKVSDTVPQLVSGA